MDSEELLKQDLETRKWLDDIESFRSPPPLRNIFAESVERSDPRTVKHPVTSEFVLRSTSDHEEEFGQKVRKFQLSSAHPYANRGRIEKSKWLATNSAQTGSVMKDDDCEKIRITKEQANALKEAVKKETRPVNMCASPMSTDMLPNAAAAEAVAALPPRSTLDSVARSSAVPIDGPQPFYSRVDSSTSSSAYNNAYRYVISKESVGEARSDSDTRCDHVCGAEGSVRSAGSDQQKLARPADGLNDAKCLSPMHGYQTLIADKEVSDIFSKSTHTHNGKVPETDGRRSFSFAVTENSDAQQRLEHTAAATAVGTAATCQQDAEFLTGDSRSRIRRTACQAVVTAPNTLDDASAALQCAVSVDPSYGVRSSVSAARQNLAFPSTVSTRAVSVEQPQGRATKQLGPQSPILPSLPPNVRAAVGNTTLVASVGTSDHSATNALLRQQAQYEILEREVENELKARNVMYGYCSACGKEVTSSSEATHALDHLYHSECFTCCCCVLGRRLKDKKFYEARGRIYCEEDYLVNLNGICVPQQTNENNVLQYSGFQQSAEKCATCGHLIMDMILQAAGKSFHPQCFRCSTCKKCLDGVPFTVDNHGRFYCVQDYHLQFAPKCAKCNKCITPSRVSDCVVYIVFVTD
ncbi:unnamed protein product [Soboliphyme baturini]|uniref:LIM zinc-binding domain-containing protein n=1 Tax=Soboliphyme baturini TaxID=241478 RepID=A0A183J0E6_9BILA|nr:unnamed protein product [Soboliphyme baturini]